MRAGMPALRSSRSDPPRLKNSHAPRVFSHRRAPAGDRAGPAAARLDGRLPRPPSLPLPADDHGQHHRLGDPLPGGLHRRVERRRPAERHHPHARPSASRTSTTSSRATSPTACSPSTPATCSARPAGWSMWADGPAQPHQGRHPAPGRPGRDRLAALPLHHELALHPARPGALRQGRAVLLHHPGAGQAAGRVRAGAALAGPRPGPAGPVRGLARPSATSSTPASTSATRRRCKEAWQRYYFKGEMPDGSGPAPKAHVNKRRLKALKLGG